MLDYLTFVSLRSHFAETNLISLSLSQLDRNAFSFYFYSTVI